jgi:predicted transcriptional regulator
MKNDKQLFDCSNTHDIDTLAETFLEPKAAVVETIKRLCDEKMIYRDRSTYKQAEQALIAAGLHKK